MAITGMLVDGVFASEAIDSSGEALIIEGCDISSFHELKGLANWEHRGDKVEGASALDVVGKIVFAKKIYSRDDCDSNRQCAFWDKVKLPFIYGIVRLYDGAGHVGAQALAAQIRDHIANGEPALVGFSIEGSTLQKEGSRLVETVARRVAMTIKPCNKTCVSGVLTDPNAPSGFLANPEGASEGEISLPHEGKTTTRKSEHPLYARLGGFEMERVMAGDGDLKQAVADQTLTKTLTAGSTAAAPDSLAGGSALQREGLRRVSKKEKIDVMDGVSKPEAKKLKIMERKKVADIVKVVLKEYDPDKHENVRSFLKNMLPEASDEFLDYFDGMSDSFTVKKSSVEDLLLQVEACQVDVMGLSKTEEQGVLPLSFLPLDGPRLADGVDPTKPLLLTSAGAWYKSDMGVVFIRRATFEDGEWSSARKMVDYARIAADFFGIQPQSVAACYSPTGHSVVSVQLGVAGYEPLHNVHELSEESQKQVARFGENGSLFRCMVTDLVLGLDYRPPAACVVGDGGVVLLASDRCFSQSTLEPRFERPPAYLAAVEALTRSPATVSNEDLAWLLSLKEERLHEIVPASGSCMPDGVLGRMIAGLSDLQLRVYGQKDKSLEEIFCKKVTHEH